MNARPASPASTPTAPATSDRVASCRPPAKLNLFLELLGRRDDGFHEIDTVMVPIDWRDRLSVRRTAEREISLRVGWLPGASTLADRLAVPAECEPGAALLRIPTDQSNLVCKALRRFTEHFGVTGGFQVELFKSIPAGAGMGGASSDAASALRCAAELCSIDPANPDLSTIAAEIGSDVPFFLGIASGKSDTASTITTGPMRAARATGRGERLATLHLGATLQLVVIYPNVSLSTAEVYSGCQIPAQSVSPDRLISALSDGESAVVAKQMLNRLAEPARKLAPQIDEILQSLWRTGLPGCQLTGSGSACFAVARSSREARRCASRLRSWLEPGCIVMATRTASVPSQIDIG